MFWKCLLTLWAVVSLAAAADPPDRARSERLFSQFLSPCCWSETLAVHRSPEARELRLEIERRISNGETDEQIKQALVQTYTRRILVVPDGRQGLWLFVIPVLALLAGLAGVVRVIYRWHRRATDWASVHGAA
jgi:cytochrome c-type biogenesis protein CcmH/NrfF